MTDIVDVLRMNDECEEWTTIRTEFLRQAADEIERLNKALKWEQHLLSRIGTHSEGCWQWGPSHYQCAVRRIEELSNAS